MNEPIVPLLTEHSAAQQAVAALERGDQYASLTVLRRALTYRRPPDNGLDGRPDDIIRIRAYVEQAIVELEHGDPACALDTLRRGLAPAGDSAKGR